MSTGLDRVAFKLLSTSQDEESTGEDDEELDCQYDRSNWLDKISLKFPLSSGCLYSRYGENKTCRLSILAYLVICIITLLFFMRNSILNVDNSSSTTANSRLPIRLTYASAPHHEASHYSYQPYVIMDNSSINERPGYDDYLASVLSERNSFGSSSLDDLRDIAREHSGVRPWWKIAYRNNMQYVTVTNYIRAKKSFNYTTSITLTTQATTNFLHHTVELCKRWDGPMSIAIFCPQEALSNAITLIKFMRQCLPPPLVACIKDKVTWHLVYETSQGPHPDELSFPKHHLESKRFRLFTEHNQCPKYLGPEPIDLVKQFEHDLRMNASNDHRLYPINVLRNTARYAATTKHVLASDIELYPSTNLVPMFSNYIAHHNVSNEYPSVRKYVFTFPIFEVKANRSAPKTKLELLDMINRGDAIFFHKYVCDACQNFPNRSNWLNDDGRNPHEITIFTVTKRDKTRSFWEPIYIGTNEDPPYDDNMTWDGRRDKMSQMYEICLQDYSFLVLGNAFLVHAPGIKLFDKEKLMKNLEYIRENNGIYDRTIMELRRQYSKSATIETC